MHAQRLFQLPRPNVPAWGRWAGTALLSPSQSRCSAGAPSSGRSPSHTVWTIWSTEHTKEAAYFKSSSSKNHSGAHMHAEIVFTSYNYSWRMKSMVFAPSHVQFLCYFCMNSPKRWCSSSSRSLCLLFAFCQQPLIQSASHLVGIMQYKVWSRYEGSS